MAIGLLSLGNLVLSARFLPFFHWFRPDTAQHSPRSVAFRTGFSVRVEAAGISIAIKHPTARNPCVTGCPAGRSVTRHFIELRIRIHPAEALDARRKTVRTHRPELSRDAFIKVQDGLLAQGHTHIALTLGLCREFGLRVREAALLNCWKALGQAAEGIISIERGTKGGRSKSTAAHSFVKMDS